MQELKEKILSAGVVLDGNILKVDSFLNHQIDVPLMRNVGEEFAKYFKDKNITKIVTLESSGIAPATFAGMFLGVPVIFARKKKSLTLNEELITAEVVSYTKKETNTVSVSKKYINSDDNVLIIDDFLAKGEAVKGLINIIKQTEATIVGVGIVIEKYFQGGRKYILDEGIPLLSLAVIKSLDGKVEFLD